MNKILTIYVNTNSKHFKINLPNLCSHQKKKSENKTAFGFLTTILKRNYFFNKSLICVNNSS